MGKYLSLLKYELKHAFKDSMNLFMLFYPLLMAFVTGFLVPKVVGLTNANPIVASYLYLSMFLITLTIGSIVGGVLLGYSLIESKDEKTINSVAVTPASIKGYVLFKSIYCTLISLIGTIVMIYAIKLLGGANFAVMTSAGISPVFDHFSDVQILVFSLVNSLLTPAFALVMAAIAKNKVEGFVIMKSSGIFFILPVLMMLPFFSGTPQYILGVLPHFWCLKAVYNSLIQSPSGADLPFWLYQIIGALYTLAFAVGAYALFNRKLQITT